MVSVYRQGSFRYVTAKDPATSQFIDGTVAVQVGGVNIPAYLGRNFSRGGTPAIFRLTGVSGAGVATFTADDGRQGTASL